MSGHGAAHTPIRRGQVRRFMKKGSFPGGENIFMSILKFLMQKLIVFISFGIVGSLLIVPPVLSQEALPENWEFSTSLNLWGPTIKSETSSGEEVEVTISDILKNLDMTLMGSVGVSKDKWLFYTDVLHMSLDDSSNSTLVDDPPVLNLALTNTKMKSWIVSPKVGYNVLRSDSFSLYLLAGARYHWVENTLKLQAKTESGTVSSNEVSTVKGWDGIVGAQGKIFLNERWYLPFYGDVGSGDSDLTWSLFAGVGYKFSKANMIVGYRYLRFNFDEDASLDHLYITGPIVGFEYVF